VKYLILGVVFIVGIYTVILVYLMLFKGLQYSDIDLNSNKIVSFQELMYCTNIGKRYIVINKGKHTKYLYSLNEKDKHKYGEIYEETYSLKDGLPIKKVRIK